MKTTEITQRIDGKLNLWHFTTDPTCDSLILDEDNAPYISKRWVIKGVYNDRAEAETAERNIRYTMA